MSTSHALPDAGARPADAVGARSARITARLDSSPPVSPAVRALARRALVAALLLGILGDLLLRSALGLNVVVIVAVLVGALAWLAHRRGRAVTAGAAVLGGLALVFAAAVAWRDSAMLTFLDLLALWTVLCALAAALRHGDALPIERAGPLDYAWGAARVAQQVAGGAPALAREARVGELATPSARHGAGTVARGFALALPALVVFGMLFAAADARFAEAAGRLVNWDGWQATSHVTLTLLLAWMAGGYLRASVVRAECADARVRLPEVLAVGAREVCIALALVDALFASFLLVQLGWLFGGAATVAGSGVTYADYARRGFFELVTVAALTLPTLLLAHARVGADAEATRGVRRAFRAAAGALVALVLLVVASAGDRMRLYVDAYGLTESRFYAAAFMTWLAAAFVLAAFALLRDRVATFAIGTLTTAWLGVLALNVANPDARIVDVNASRVAEGRKLDVSYVASLSADAVPTLATHVLPRMLAGPPDRDACAVVAAVRGTNRRWARAGDWRGWSVARARAEAAARGVKEEVGERCREGAS